MTDEQLQIKVAELAGLDTAGGMLIWSSEIPDYPNDLNAMHSLVHALRSLPGSQWHDFHTRLIDVCGSVGNAINADARTRAECYVKTMEAVNKYPTYARQEAI